MKAFVIFAVLLVAAHAADEFCYKDTARACKATTNKQHSGLLNCNAKYGAIQSLEGDFQKFANHQFMHSFDFLLMSTHYANYEKNRPGFEKLFREYSDSLWEGGIDLIKYITSRGGQMNFYNVAEDIKTDENPANFELYEIESIAKALDIEKKLALEAFNIHREATRRKEENHDPEISSHIENTYVHKHRDNIRKLAGYVTDLNSLLNGTDSTLALYLFDDYLQKQ